MKFSPVFVLFALLALVAGVALSWWMHRRAQEALARKENNLARQAFVIGQLDALGDLLKNQSLPADDLEAQSASILLAMEAINDYGRLTAVIDDTRNVVGEECARRKAKAR
jgi:hypothetical protein